MKPLSKIKGNILSDPDKIRLGIEIDVDINGKTIKLYRNGNLKEGQIDWRVIYSFLKKIWREVPFRFIMFPIRAVDRHEFELINDWDFADDETREMVTMGNWWVMHGDKRWKEYKAVEIRKQIIDLRTKEVLLDEIERR